jgi:hypothetical protein
MELYLSILMLVCALALLLTIAALILAVCLIRDLHERLSQLNKLSPWDNPNRKFNERI